MRYSLEGVAKGQAALALHPTWLTVQTGHVTVTGITTQQGPSVLSLVAAGRMRPSSGEIRCTTRDGDALDGRAARGYLRQHVALVDTPRVCEPPETMTVRDITAEELTFAGRRSNPITANRALEELGMRELSSQPIGLVAPDDRLRLLTELALRRPGIEGLVLTTPDRHGGDDRHWLASADALAARGLAVLVVTGAAAARRPATTSIDIAHTRAHAGAAAAAEAEAGTGTGTGTGTESTTTATPARPAEAPAPVPAPVPTHPARATAPASTAAAHPRAAPSASDPTSGTAAASASAPVAASACGPTAATASATASDPTTDDPTADGAEATDNTATARDGTGAAEPRDASE